VIHDKIPEITEELTLTVVRADGTKSETIYKDGRLLHGYVSIDWSKKVSKIAEEILNHGRKRKDQT
jgi:HD superfamily phosphohydrolase YqeK